MHTPSFSIEINAGKGGVGKSTTSASKGLHYAEAKNLKTLILDMDGGKALARVLQFPFSEVNTILPVNNSNLHFASIQNTPYLKSKREAGNYKAFIEQFKGDQGYTAYNAMLYEFFGACTDVAGLEKLIFLICLLHTADQQGYEKVIIDVEPTSGLERLINSIETAAGRIENLGEMSKIVLGIVGAKWKDIAAFIKDGYVKNADYYTERLRAGKDIILQSKFSAITIAEPDPVEQLIEDVSPLIDKIQGKLGNVIVNNYGRNNDIAKMEMEQLQKITDWAKTRETEEQKIDVKVIQHNANMFLPNLGRNTLRQIGEILCES